MQLDKTSLKSSSFTGNAGLALDSSFNPGHVQRKVLSCMGMWRTAAWDFRGLLPITADNADLARPIVLSQNKAASYVKSTWSLRSLEKTLQELPLVNIKLGNGSRDRTFSVMAPWLWNFLPREVGSAFAQPSFWPVTWSVLLWCYLWFCLKCFFTCELNLLPLPAGLLLGLGNLCLHFLSLPEFQAAWGPVSKERSPKMLENHCWKRWFLHLRCFCLSKQRW